MNSGNRYLYLSPLTKLMQRALSLFCLLASLSFTTVLNAQTTNPFFRHIPPDAEQVYHINLAALGSKISWDDISGLIPAPKSASDQEMMKYIKDPSQSGIDFHQGFIVATSHLDKNADSPTVVTILAQLSDSGKLLSLIRSKEKGLHTFKFPKGSASGKDKMALAWNEKMIVVTIVTTSSKNTQNLKSSTGSPAPYYTLTAAKKSVAALEGFANSIYTTDPTFINGFSDDADFHAWSEPGSFLYQLMEMSKKKNPLAASGMNIPKPKSQLHSLTAFRFDVGKITLHTSTVVPPDSAKIYSIFNTRPLNTDLITHLPGKSVLGMFNMHIAPSSLDFLLEHYHTKHMVDSMLAKTGLTIDDFTKALKGDFLIAGMEPTEKPDTGDIKPSFFFVTTIADMPTFMKIVGKLGLNKDSSGGLMGKKIGFTLRDNILVVGPKGKTDAFFSTNNPANLNLVDDRVRDNAFSFVVDIKAISGLIAEANHGEPSRKTQQALHFLSALDRITYAAGNYKDGKTEYYFELKMTDSSENSLRSLLKLIH